MDKIFVLMLLIAFSFGLRSSSDPSPQYFSPSVYEKNLNDIQTRFEHQIDQLKSQLAEVNAVIADANKTTGVKIVSLQQKLAEQRNSLYNIQQYLNLPFQFKACECRELSDEQKKMIKQKSIDINKKIQSLQQQINVCANKNCQQNQYLVEQLKSMKVYIITVDGIINSDCCRQKYQFKQQQPVGIVDMSNYLYKDNLKSRDWTYGNITQEEYKLKIFQLSTKYNVSSCPVNKPFADVKFNRCQKCDIQGAVFDLGARTCLFCGKLAFLNTTTSKCQHCPPNQYYNHTKRACYQCSHEHFLNVKTQSCQECPKGQHFNSLSNQCQKCPQNNQYDTVKRLCRPCNNTAAEFFNSQIQKCQDCPLRLRYNETSLKCQPCQNNSYYDKIAGSCTPCDKSLILNPRTLQCQPCPDNSFLNQKLKKCVTCPPTYKYDSVTQKCISITPPPPKPNTTQCPPNTPVFNQQLQKCEACPPGFEYNPYEKNCLNHLGVCPKDRPFFNITQNKCQSCPKGTTFNSLSYTCNGSEGHTQVEHSQV